MTPSSYIIDIALAPWMKTTVASVNEGATPLQRSNPRPFRISVDPIKTSDIEIIDDGNDDSKNVGFNITLNLRITQ